MTIRNFDALFNPQAVALIGASNEPNSVGAVLARNLFECGFRGAVMPVNPHEQAIRSAVNYRSIGELPEVPDLAVIATPASTVPGIIAELGARGCRAAIVISAGFGEGERPDGAALRQAMLEASRPHLLRIVGPNCLGFISPAIGLNASFVHLQPRAGHLAFVSQSGALVTAVLDWAAARDIGFSHVVSLGGMSDVDFGDMLDYLALDRATEAILLYVESITDARKFMTAGRIAARAKPVVVIKAGRTPAGARAALSHTGALAGADAVYDAAFRRAGMLRVYDLRELFEATTTLASGMRPGGGRLAVLTNGGGAGVLAADALHEYGGALSELEGSTLAKLDAVLPKAWSRGNPVDILGDATGARYAAALEILLSDPKSDAILVLNCPTAVADSLEAAQAVVETYVRLPRKLILTSWLGDPAAEASRKLFASRRIATYDTPNEAVRALMQSVNYSRNQNLLIETPPAVPAVDQARSANARGLISTMVATGRSLLTEPEAKTLLSEFGIPVVETFVATSAVEAADLARSIGRPVALKILSHDIVHKSDVGGVSLDLGSPEAVKAAAEDMLSRVRARMPHAQIAGFTVQEMIRRPQDYELLAGIASDPTFGPIVTVGQGGTAVEVLADTAVGLPPLNLVLAREMIARTRVATLLGGYRDRPPANTDAIASILVRLSELLIACPEIAELDINPLLAGAEGALALALDARVVLVPAGARRSRLAIQPYPTQLEREIDVDGGLRVLVRPIRPEDEPQIVALVNMSSSADVRMRFLAPLKAFPHELAARLSQIDYDREMALIAVDLTGKPGEILGVSRIVADPEIEKAEFAVMVRSDMKGRGIGFRLMKEILSYARARGIKVVHGDVLAENETMLMMAGELGFERGRTESGVVPVSLRL